MRAILTSFGIQRALFLALLLALALAPAVEAAHHGPAALVAEADHHAHPSGPDHHHPEGQHDANDHDHISVVLLAGHGSEVHANPDRQALSGPVVAGSSSPDNPKRPPRPTMT